MSSTKIKISESDLIENFPFREIRPKQLEGMKQIAQAINEGFKIIVLEAPTGFGKSPVAIALGRTLGSSYICSATKDLQSQYTKDFPFLRSVKGMSNYDCLVKEDLILNNTYACQSCRINQRDNDPYVFNNIEVCKHKTVGYGPCREGNNAFEHVPKSCPLCSQAYNYRHDGEDGDDYTDDNGNGDDDGDGDDGTIVLRPQTTFHSGCRYRTYSEDYEVSHRDTNQEVISINETRLARYHEYSTDNSDSTGAWMHLKNITNKDAIENRTLNDFTPCQYYDQLNKVMLASHTIFNYANFLIFLRRSGPNAKKRVLGYRDLLILDEGHQIENQIVDDVEITISKKTLQRYIPLTNLLLLENSNLDYESDIETEWVVLLDSLYTQLDISIETVLSGETKTDAKQYSQRLGDTIRWIKENPGNWIVSEIVYEDEEGGQGQEKLKYFSNPNPNLKPKSKINKVVFKPLDVSPYCRPLFDLTGVTLIMSATILDVDTFCHNIGLDRSKVKFIEMGSEFPIENRPIYPMNTAHLNYTNLQIDRIHRKIAASIDKIMDHHSNEKGVIHTTSYAQVNFIKSLLSDKNLRRLTITDPEIPRDEIIAKHSRTSNNNSVLISPSVHTGLDLKDELSRFQILVKVPYPSLGDRWIRKKQMLDGGKWYRWQTVLKTVQAYGRSVRSKDDWAKTYLLDSSFDNFIRTSKFPGWFLEAIMLCPHQQQLLFD